MLSVTLIYKDLAGILMKKNILRSKWVTFLAAVILSGGISVTSWAEEAEAPADTTADVQVDSSVAAEKDGSEIVNLKPDTPMFKLLDNKIITNTHFETQMRCLVPSSLNRAGERFTTVNGFTRDQVIDAIKEYAVYRTAYLHANDLDLALSADQKTQMQREISKMARETWLELCDQYSGIEPSKADIKNYYDEHKELDYVTRETMRLRHIYFSTYTPHVVEEGETLESIAQDIAGDASLADHILNADTKERRSKELKDEAGNTVPPRALQMGETVLVPMSEEAVAQVEEKAKQVYERLKEGEDFRSVAEEVSESNKPGAVMTVIPEVQERGLLPEIVEVFKGLEDGGFSEPIRTKHGIQIIKRSSYQPRAYKPIEEVGDQIASILREKNKKAKYQEILDYYWGSDDSVPVNKDVLMNVDNPTMADKVIYELGNVKYTAAQYLRDFPGEEGLLPTFDERRMLLARIPNLQRYLEELGQKRMNVAGEADYQKRLFILTCAWKGISYLQYRQENAEFEPTEDEIRNGFFELQDYLKTLPAVDLYQITVKADYEEGDAVGTRVKAISKLVESMEETSKNIQSLEDFMKLAKEISEDKYAERGGHVGNVRGPYMNGLGQEIIQIGKTNYLFGPKRTDDGEMLLFWVGNIVHNPNSVSYDEVKDVVIQALKRKNMASVRDKVMQELIDEANIEILF